MAAGTMTVAALVLLLVRSDRPIPPIPAIVTPAPTSAESEPPDPLPPAPPSLESLVGSVVRVELVGTEQGQATGTLVSKDGDVLTIVVEPPTSIKIHLSDGRTYDAIARETGEGAELRGFVTVCGPVAGSPIEGLPAPIGLADSGLESGTPISVIGYPFGAQRPSISRGIISSPLVRLPGLPLNLVQFDANVPPGAEGGPVVDETGRILAVVAGELPGAESMSYALPISYALRLLPASATSGAAPTPVSRPARRVTPRPEVKKVEGEAKTGSYSVEIRGVSWTDEGPIVFVAILDASRKPAKVDASITIVVSRPGAEACETAQAILASQSSRSAPDLEPDDSVRASMGPFVAINTVCPGFSGPSPSTRIEVKAFVDGSTVTGVWP